MPLTGPASYLLTTDDFISHWTSANAALPPATPIVLAAAATVTTLTTLRADLESQRAAVESTRNGVELARANIETLKADLLERLNQFNGKLASLAPDSPFMNLRPKAYSQGDGIGRVLPPLRTIEFLVDACAAQMPPASPALPSRSFDDRVVWLIDLFERQARPRSLVR